MDSELLDALTTIGSFSDKYDVRVVGHECGNTESEERMIINDQESNGSLVRRRARRFGGFRFHR
jgi:hypothetical protein